MSRLLACLYTEIHKFLSIDVIQEQLADLFLCILTELRVKRNISEIPENSKNRVTYQIADIVHLQFVSFYLSLFEYFLQEMDLGCYLKHLFVKCFSCFSP